LTYTARISECGVSVEQYQRAIREIARYCAENDIDELEVMIGWGAQVPVSDLWRKTTIRVHDVMAHVQSLQDQRILELGKTDVFFESDSPNWRVDLTHESGIVIHAASEAVLPALGKRLADALKE
jgi:hypothetical protein